MDASNRCYHVYGKTHSGKGALTSARGAVSSIARRLLILIDGQRTLGDLSGMLGSEAFDRSLQELEALGYVELVRHFPEVDERPAPAPAPAPPPPRATVGPVRTRRRRLRAAVVVPAMLAILVAALAGAGLIFSKEIETASADAIAGLALLLAPPPDPAVATDAAPSAVKAQRSSAPARPAAAAARKTAGRMQTRTEIATDSATVTPAPVAPSAALHVRTQVEPQLPQQAKELGIKSGQVVVVLHVAPAGTVERVELVSAAPPQVYDERMQQAFAGWTFDPPGVHGRMTVQVEVVPQDGAAAAAPDAQTAQAP